MQQELLANQFQKNIVELIIKKIKENAARNERTQEIILSSEELSKVQGCSDDVTGDLKALSKVLVGYTIKENVKDGKYIAYPPILDSCYSDGNFTVKFNKLFFEA